MKPTDAAGMLAPSCSPVQTERVLAVVVAHTLIGVPYIYAGNSASGIDCSGLVQLCWREAGVASWAGFPGAIDRRARDLFDELADVAPMGPELGDVAFYGRDKITHVAIITDIATDGGGRRTPCEIISASNGNSDARDPTTSLREGRMVKAFRRPDAHLYRTDFRGFRSMPGAMSGGSESWPTFTPDPWPALGLEEDGDD